MATAAYIAKLEQDTNWQATAEDENGEHVAVMRGHPGPRVRFEKNYYLQGGAYNALVAYSLGGIEGLFESGRLKLLRGSIPDAENM